VAKVKGLLKRSGRQGKVTRARNNLDLIYRL
jgi:hypothetical protein